MTSPSCSPHFSYFDTLEFLKLSLHLVTIISTPVSCFGIYCILFKTPDQMKSVKWYMFTLHISIIMFDYFISVLTVPFLLFPEMAGISNGLLRYLGVPTSIQAFAALVILFDVGVAVIAIYENRFFILCNFRFKQSWACARRIWLLFHYLIFPIMLLPMFPLAPDQESEKLHLFQRLPCLPEYLYQEPIYFVGENYVMHIGVFAVVLFWIELGFFVTQLIRNGKKQLKSNTISEKTYQMHKQFFIALVIQVTCPILFLLIPFSYGLATIYLGYYNQTAINCVVVCVTTHGFVSTVLMIIVHRPYRLAVKEMIKREPQRRKSTVVSIG